MLGGPVQGHVAQAGQCGRTRLQRQAERRGGAAGGGEGGHTDADHGGPRRTWFQCQRERTEEHHVGHDRVRCEGTQDLQDPRELPGQRIQEDPSEILLQSTNAAPRGGLTCGVGHHQIVGVILGSQGHETGADGRHPVAVVGCGEKDHVVPVIDQPAGDGEQRCCVPLRRRGAEKKPSGCHCSTTAPPQGAKDMVPPTVVRAEPTNDIARGHREELPGGVRARPW